MLHIAYRKGMPVNALRVPAHEATTAQLGAAYPFVASRPLGVSRVLVGRDLAGGAFLHDPFALYGNGVLSNPNMTVLGQIGRGKSSLVKSYLYRQAAFGRQVAVLDPKGEYGALARALGSVPIALSPAGGVRLNPLEGFGGREVQEAGSGPDGDRTGALRQRRLALVGALAEATLRRRLSPSEHLAVEVALDTAVASAAVPTLAGVVDAMLRPPPRADLPSGATAATLAADGRDVGLELRRLVGGDLSGMFDGETSPELQRSSFSGASPEMPEAGQGTSLPAGGRGEGPPPLVLDLSDVYHSEALPALMVCATAWLQAMTAGERSRTLLVVDEAWAVLSEVAVARFLRASWKLARARGTANIAVCHRASDLSSTGSSGSEQVRLAEGLLADSETIVCYAQPASELPALASLLGCPPAALDFVPKLPRGVALWRVAGQSYLVQHVLGSHEGAFVDTDGRLRETADA